MPWTMGCCGPRLVSPTEEVMAEEDYYGIVMT